MSTLGEEQALNKLLLDKLQELIDNGVVIKTGDIEIGAVELKDHDSDNRAHVGSNGLIVYDGINENNINKLNSSIIGVKSGTDRLVSDGATDTQLINLSGTVSTENTLNKLNASLSAIQSGTDIIKRGLQNPTTSLVAMTSSGTAYKLPSSELSNRKCLIIYNPTTYDIYIGNSTVTPQNGIKLPGGGSFTIDSESGIYAVSPTNGITINVLELS